MGAESLKSRERGEQLKPRHLLYIPGALVSQSDVDNTIKPVFAKAYGEGNITMFNSAVSADKPNPERYDQMANIIIDHMQNGTGIDIVAASLGSTELWRALKIIEKKRQGFLKSQQDKSTLRIIFMAPSGFSTGIKERIAYPLRVARLNGAREKGMETFSTFADPTEVASLAALLPEPSEIQKGFNVLPTRGIRDNKEFLDDAERALLEEHRAELAGIFALDDEGARDMANNHLLKRGRDLHKGVIRVYKGKPSGETVPENTDASGQEERSRRPFLDRTRLLTRAAGNHPMLAYQKLMGMGYNNIGFRTPWADTVFPLWKIIEFYQGNIAEAQANTAITPVGNHNVLHAQPEATIQGLGTYDLFTNE